MSPSPKLGGFKILRDAVRISFVMRGKSRDLPTHLFHLIAEGKINIPFITCVCEEGTWGIHMVVASHDASGVVRLIERNIGRDFARAPCSSILSLFPHKKSPHVMGCFFSVFSRGHLEADAIANSPSAVSVVLKEPLLPLVRDALFEPFEFSAYRTPEEWRLAQEGKEQLYKEVVASYQEKRPKVYGLECHEGQELIRLRIGRGRYGDLVQPLKAYAEAGRHVTFLATGPCGEKRKEVVLLCLPLQERRSRPEALREALPHERSQSLSPVAVFSMTGPHFGDRYGIVGDLLETLAGDDIALFGLSCTIASVTGVIPSPLLDSAIGAIQRCFEVPNVIRKEV